MKYDFDRIIDRQGTNSLNTDGFREYIFKDLDNVEFPYADDEFIRMWVADMEFATPDVIVNNIKDRLDHGIFGYTRLYDSKYYQAFANWTKRRYSWDFTNPMVSQPCPVPQSLPGLVLHLSSLTFSPLNR